MRLFRRTIEEGSPKVPAYIVTFSDMTTLLLTFFVMLLSLAKMQDPELFNKGRDSFWQSIRQQGLGILSGGMEEPYFGHTKIKYFISKPDELFEDRSIDAKEEETRRIFQELSRSVTAIPSRIVAKKADFSVTGIRFLPGDASLGEATRRFLTEFCADLQGGYFGVNYEAGFQQGSGGIQLYVLGLANDVAEEKEQWILSAKRAQAVAEFITGTLNSGISRQAQTSARGVRSRWPVYWWGTGPGGDWVADDSPISRESQILIAVLRANGEG